MNKNEIYSKLTNDLQNSKVFLDEPMSKHTSFKIGGNADIFIKAQTVEDIKYILNFVDKNGVPLTVIGNGSNLLVKDNGIRGIVLQTAINEIDIDKQNQIVKVGNGVKLGELSAILEKNELTGFEFASGIPGSIGGAVRMNAGAYGREFKDIIKDVTYITKNGQIITEKCEDLSFLYRHSRFCNTNDIILFANLKLEKGTLEDIKNKKSEILKARIEKQPLDMPSAGSTFKRGQDFISAKLIDEAGLKGYQIGGAKVSEKHAGFIVNSGDATAKDVIKLIEYVQKVVYEKFNKKLETEIEIIGED